MTKHIRISERAAKLLGGAVSIGALLAFGGAASAQDSADGWVDPMTLEGVASVERTDDGGVRITFDDGRTVMVAPEYVSDQGGVLLVHLDGVDMAGGAFQEIPTSVLLGGGAILIGGVAAASGGGGGEANVAPTFSSATASASTAENSTATGFTASATDSNGDTLTYSIAGGADASAFTIDPSTGVLTFAAAPDFENPGDANNDNVYEVTIEVSDGEETATQTVRITVTNANDNAPVFTGDGVGQADENGTATTYTAAASDADGDTVTFSISGGADGALFAIDAATGVLTLLNAQDFEAAGDADADGVYEVVVQASDGANTTTQTVLITLQDVNEAPAISSGAAAAFDENGAGVAYDADASDPDGDTLTYAISGGADAALFSIDAATGEVRFLAAPDFENPADANSDNVYEIIVSASDGSETTTRTVEITVNNVNDNAPVITSGGSASVSENSTGVVLDVDASDLDGGSLNYAIVGSDAQFFSIDAATGEITFNTPPDFENPSDANADNVYELTVRVSDGVNGAQQTVQITVTNENDNDPVFTSGATASVAENAAGVAYTAAATDADGDTVTYSISGGADASLFTIDAATGQLSFVTPPDFEQPGDADLDNAYEVIIEASDGVRTVTQAVTIDVTNTNDNNPAITSSPNFTVDENLTPVGQVTANDLDGDTITYSIIFGPDQGLFTIDSATGEISFLSPPDFENPGDQNADNVYEILVRASDGVNSVDQTVFITVGNTNDNAPQFTVNQTSFSLPEGTSGSLGIVDATDADGSTLTWSISGGSDASAFTIDAATGELSLAAPLDFENPTDSDQNNSYSVEVTVSDGVATDTITLTMTVTDVNDVAPVFTSGATASQQENTTVTGYTAAAADAVEGDPVTYSIAGGADASLFTIDANTGVLSFITAPDFENPLDADTDNVYEVIIRANDGANDTDQTVQVTVTDIVNEQAPVFTSSTTASFDENATGAAYTASATDPQNDPVTFAITGGADASLFSINATTGEVTFNSSPDFENPGDADTNNVYVIEITATDGANPTVQTVQISVNNLNDNTPVITSSAGPWTFVENATGVAVNVDATDADGDAITYSIVGGADASLFVIDPNTGELRFIAPPDHEAPADSNSDNTYEVEVEASDGVTVTTQVLQINVADDNDNTPEITSSSAQNVDENFNGVVYTATANDADATANLTWSITGGIDASLFTIDAATGAVTLLADQNFENPGDADQGGDYEVEITVSDGVNTDTQTVTITLDDVNEAPTIALGNGPFPFSFAENGTDTLFNTQIAQDPDGDSLTYSLAGADAALFQINPNTLNLEFISAPDFENPSDADNDGVYEVSIVASDGSLTNALALEITVTDGPDAPDFTASPAQTAQENQTSAFTATAVDPDGPTPAPTFSITGGADAALFSINPTTGEVSFNTAPDFENPTDADTDGVYEVEVTASDGSLSSSQLFQVTVSDANDNPTQISQSTFVVSFDENLSGVVFTPPTPTDADADAIIRFGNPFSATGDEQFFSIDPLTGAVSVVAPLDFENAQDSNSDNVYEFFYQVFDDRPGGGAQTIFAQITINDVGGAAQTVITPVPVAADDTFSVPVWQADWTDGMSGFGEPADALVCGLYDPGYAVITDFPVIQDLDLGRFEPISVEPVADLGAPAEHAAELSFELVAKEQISSAALGDMADLNDLPALLSFEQLETPFGEPEPLHVDIWSSIPEPDFLEV